MGENHLSVASHLTEEGAEEESCGSPQRPTVRVKMLVTVEDKESYFLLLKCNAQSRVRQEQQIKLSFAMQTA